MFRKRHTHLASKVPDEIALNDRQSSRLSGTYAYHIGATSEDTVGAETTVISRIELS
jgi:hypothetical protein